MTHEHQPGSEPADGRELQPTAPDAPETERPLRPRIWVGSLADYVSGDLHGEWLDAARAPDDIHADIHRMLSSGPAARRGEAPEEWGIFDYDEFGGLQLGEYEAVQEVSRLAQLVARYGEPFAFWAEAVGYVEGLVEAIEGDDIFETVPSWLQHYVRLDYAALARDMKLNGDILTLEDSADGVYFR